MTKTAVLRLAIVLAITVAGGAQAAPPTQPDQQMTPGAVDPKVTDSNICSHDWARGAPPTEGGDLTYSKAARETPKAVKDQAFSEYGLQNPHDRGATFEVDHRVPLSLGGRDEIQNLWPQTRDRSVQWNAWVKDRLEFKIYNLVCHPASGQPPLSLSDAQAVFLGDWTAAYQRYCPTEADCPAYKGNDASESSPF